MFLFLGYKDEHRVTLYLKWMKQMNENFDIDACQNIVNEFNAKFVEKDPEVVRMKQHQIMNLNYQLEAWSNDILLRLQNIFKRMMAQGRVCKNPNFSKPDPKIGGFGSRSLKTPNSDVNQTQNEILRILRTVYVLSRTVSS